MDTLPIVIAVISVSLSGISIVHSFEISDTRKDTIYAICNQARISPEITEKECGNLQDEWHMEFMCDQANTSSNNTCWVETK